MRQEVELGKAESPVEWKFFLANAKPVANSSAAFSFRSFFCPSFDKEFDKMRSRYGAGEMLEMFR